MPSGETLILTAADVRRLLSLGDCIAAVEQAFALLGDGKAQPPGALGMHRPGGGFHIKAGVLDLDRAWFAAKVNGNFPGNRAAHGVPTIQGVLVLADADTGSPLALMDSAEITTMRTGAATAVAAKYLARAGADTAAIIGCGVQGRIQVRALHAVRPLRRVHAVDKDPGAAALFARDMAQVLGIDVSVTLEARTACAASDMVVTCTPAHAPVLFAGDLGPGTFLAAVGADHPEKHEIAPELLAECRVVVDVLDQAAAFGDLHHALASGTMRRDQVVGELSAVVAGRVHGRVTDDDVVVFDSTGMALQDVAAAAAVYRRALDSGAGTTIALGEGSLARTGAPA